MEVSRIALVIVDIGGYTEFIKFHKDSIVHAHEVISQLLENIADATDHPLVLNKFEGDAALMYARVRGDETAFARDIARQVFALFPTFKKKAEELSTSRSFCPCGACQNIRDLRLKAIVHKGTAAFRKIRQFEEIAGEDVIVAHRLLKNGVDAGEYILMSDDFSSLLDEAFRLQGRPHSEAYEHLGTITLKVFDPWSDHPPPRNVGPRKSWRRFFGGH